MRLMIKAKRRPIGHVTPGGYIKTAKGWRKVSGTSQKTAKEDTLEGRSIVYHHTEVGPLLKILRSGNLRAGYLNEYKWVSLTPQLNYPTERLPGDPQVSIQLDKVGLANAYKLSRQKGTVEKGEVTIQGRTVPIGKFIKKIVIREDLSKSEFADYREDYAKLLEVLKKKKIPYVFKEYGK